MEELSRTTEPSVGNIVRAAVLGQERIEEEAHTISVSRKILSIRTFPT